jgi:hypothetical protein
MNSNEQFDTTINDALHGFNKEAVLYCQGISDPDAQEYAMDYARLLRRRAQGLHCERIRFLKRVFEPKRTLIDGALDKMYYKYFAA